MDKVAAWMEKHWVVRILDSLAKLGIVIALISWGIDLSEQKKQREVTKRLAVYAAHEVLSLSHFRSSTATGMALEDLIKAEQDLFGMDLTTLIVINVDLSNANFSETDFGESKFKNVKLVNANFSNAELTSVLFNNVDMARANLYGVYFEGADLRGAKNITSAQLSTAILCKNTKLPSYLTGIKLGLTKEQEKTLREKYNNNNYIQSSIESCGVQ
ncbi:MAG: hypothetical protein COB07_08220 [Sulfurovum sp.]|nr:MAG: hypothetical protein COB07_08220 [Sulfurovum sp.]